MEYVKTFESFILDENELFEANFGGKRVVIFPGRFQPFHNGHIAALKKASDIFKLPVVPIQILSKTDKSPFPDSLLIPFCECSVNNKKNQCGLSIFLKNSKFSSKINIKVTLFDK